MAIRVDKGRIALALTTNLIAMAIVVGLMLLSVLPRWEILWPGYVLLCTFLPLLWKDVSWRELIIAQLVALLLFPLLGWGIATWAFSAV